MKLENKTSNLIQMAHTINYTSKQTTVELNDQKIELWHWQWLKGLVVEVIGGFEGCTWRRWCKHIVFWVVGVGDVQWYGNRVYRHTICIGNKYGIVPSLSIDLATMAPLCTQNCHELFTMYKETPSHN